MICSLKFFRPILFRPHVRPWILYIKKDSLSAVATWMMGAKLVPATKGQGAGMDPQKRTSQVLYTRLLDFILFFGYSSYRSFVFRKA